MRKMHFFVMVAAALFAQAALPDDTMTENTKPCATIAKACLKAGYTRNNQNSNKKFWIDCMKPAILGHTVKGVKIDDGTIKSCRSDKITELKSELSEFESVSSN